MSHPFSPRFFSCLFPFTLFRWFTILPRLLRRHLLHGKIRVLLTFFAFCVLHALFSFLPLFLYWVLTLVCQVDFFWCPVFKTRHLPSKRCIFVSSSTVFLLITTHPSFALVRGIFLSPFLGFLSWPGPPPPASENLRDCSFPALRRSFLFVPSEAEFLFLLLLDFFFSTFSPLFFFPWSVFL